MTDKTELSKDQYEDKSGNHYVVADGNVFQVTVDFERIHLDTNLDSELLTDHIYDYIEEDSELIQKKSESSFVYESKKYNKLYDVDYVLDEQGLIMSLLITQHI